MDEAIENPVVWTFRLGKGKDVTVSYYPRWHSYSSHQFKYRLDHFEFEGSGVSVTGYHAETVTVDPDPAYDATVKAYAYAKKRVVELTGIGIDD